MIVATANTIELGHRQREDDELDAGGEQCAEHETERDAERAADQRRDHALVTDHAADLPPRHPDRAQHPELARPLEHRQDERVHDAEQADDDGEREQHVEHVEDRVQRPDLVVDELLLRLHLRVRERRELLLERRLVRVGLAALHLHEREDVLRLVVDLVPGGVRDRDAARTASRPWAGRRCRAPRAEAARRSATSASAASRPSRLCVFA